MTNQITPADVIAEIKAAIKRHRKSKTKYVYLIHTRHKTYSTTPFIKASTLENGAIRLAIRLHKTDILSDDELIAEINKIKIHAGRLGK